MSILGPRPLRVPIGQSDYVTIRRDGYAYVDKTALVAQIIDSSASSLLLPRPRRFGKTLNLSTLRHFFERPPVAERPNLGAATAEHFTDTAIWNTSEGRYRAHFQRYPVIYLSFKDVKAHTWTDAWASVRGVLQDELDRLWHHHQLDARFSPTSRAAQLRARFGELDAEPGTLAPLLTHLIQWCQEATGQPAVLLIDEYDAPLLTAWQHDYYDAAIQFFRAFYPAGLKDQPALFRGVLTGILKVAKEGIFSGLNNVRTHSLLDDDTATAFGFTSEEVEVLAHETGSAHHLPGIREWYDGYRFGAADPQTLYNPWSVLNFLAAPRAGLQSYWKNTSSNDLVHELLLDASDAHADAIAALLRGDAFTATLDDNVPLNTLRQDPNALWALLTYTGYLTPTRVEPGLLGRTCDLRIPNLEVRAVYATTFLRLIGQPLHTATTPLTTALLSGDAPALEHHLQTALLHTLSHHELGHRPPEAIYQAFLLGLLTLIQPTHNVTSNREAGHGRADVLITPKQPGHPGAVLELKTLRPGQDPEPTLQQATTQLQTKDYAAPLRAQGADPIHQYAIAFDGKRCHVRAIGA